MPKTNENIPQGTPSGNPSGEPKHATESRLAELGVYDLSTELKNCLNGIGSALNGAIMLAHPYAEYEEDGTPRYSDAEVEAACGAAEKHLQTLEEAIVHTRRALVLTALQNYKNYLNYDAIIGFESSGVDEMERSVDYEGRFEGSFEAATKVVAGLDKSRLMELGQDMLVEDLRHDIALFRTKASKGPQNPGPARGPTDEDYQAFRATLDARSTLLEKEDALDAILYRSQTGDQTPTNSVERGWHVVANTSADSHILDEAHTEEVATYRKQSFETGALLSPKLEELTVTNIVVEEAE